MNDSGYRPTEDDEPRALTACFRPSVAVIPLDREADAGDVRLVVLPDAESEPSRLDNSLLPLLVVPEGERRSELPDEHLAIVAVEGSDRGMAEALASLLDPDVARIALVHVTWIPGIASSALSGDGVDNPSPADLLAYQGAREALVDTAQSLRDSGFVVSTHLREDRDPAVPLSELVARHEPDLFVLGLGRHGAGIGRRLLERVRVPVLFVRAR